MNFYTASSQLQSRFSNAHANEPAGVYALGGPWTQLRDGIDTESEEESTSTSSSVSIRSLAAVSPEEESHSSVQFGELFQSLVCNRVAMVGVGNVETAMVQALEGVGRQLADVASKNYRVPRVIDAGQRAKRAAAVAMLRGWLETESDPAEAREWEQFKRELDEDRPSLRKLFP